MPFDLNFISKRIQFITHFIVCVFNAISKEQIVAGFKNKFTIDEAHRGREFCKLIRIDFDSIANERNKDQVENIHYLIQSMLEIEEVRNLVK